MGIRDQLLAAVGKSRLSERQLSVLATGSTDTIRSIRRGGAPRLDTVEELGRVVGLELQFGSRLSRPDVESRSGPRSPTEFSESRELPVYKWAAPSAKGYLRQERDSSRARAPVDLADEQAFYVVVPDDSMMPARIQRGSCCLISPCAQLEVDQRAWFRDPTGREMLRWVMRLPPGGYDLGAWEFDEVGHKRPVHVTWRREEAVDRGVVLAVYREVPTAAEPLEPAADWRPDALDELWRSARFSEAARKTEAWLDEAVKAVEAAEMEIKRGVQGGTLSDHQAELILRVVDYRLQASLRNIRSSITGDLSGEGGDASSEGGGTSSE